jgi:hypothetical protein
MTFLQKVEGSLRVVPRGQVEGKFSPQVATAGSSSPGLQQSVGVQVVPEQMVVAG